MIFKSAIVTLLVALILAVFMVNKAEVLVTSGPFQPHNPYRVLDTRQTGIVEAGGIVPVTTRVPLGASGAAVNITITDPEGLGFLTAWDGRSEMPTASVVNVVSPGTTVANYAIVPLSDIGTFYIYSSVRTHIVVDVMGYVVSPNVGWVQPFKYAEGTSLAIGDRGWQVLDGRASYNTAVSLINSCQGAVLFHGDFDSYGLIAAHRTSCGSKGFGGVESMGIGDRITINTPTASRTYELFWKMDGVPLVNEGTSVPYGTSIILQTSQDASHVYFRYFRLV